MTDRPDKITAEYVPAPPVVVPDKIVIRAPQDKRGYPVFPDLHLSIDQARELLAELEEAVLDAESRPQGHAADY